MKLRTRLGHAAAAVAAAAAALAAPAAYAASTDVTATVHAGEFCGRTAHGDLVTLGDVTLQCVQDPDGRRWRWISIVEPDPADSPTPSSATDTTSPAPADTASATASPAPACDTATPDTGGGYGTVTPCTYPPTTPAAASSASPAPTLPVTGDNTPGLLALAGGLVLAGTVALLSLRYWRRGHHRAA